MGSLSAERRRRLEEMERVAEELDNLHLTFAKRAAPFNNWLDSVREDLSDLVIVHDMSEIERLVKAHHEFKATLPDAEQGFRGIIDLEQVSFLPFYSALQYIEPGVKNQNIVS